MSDNLLKPVDDDLPMRESNDYARVKLRIIEGFIGRFITSMRDKWPALYYIDLFAGPGKNVFPDHSLMLGSPLIALTARHAFTHYRFVEADQSYCQALAQRVRASDSGRNVRILHGDCNELVTEIAAEISTFDTEQRFLDLRPSLNLAVLDPEDLALEWRTVSLLGEMNRMDLIINFSTSGVTRNARIALDTGQTDRIDKFFGTDEWQNVYRNAPGDGTHRRRALLDIYKDRLGELGYQTITFGTNDDEAVFRNRKNTQVYTLIGASKNRLGREFWVGSIRDATQPKLL